MADQTLDPWKRVQQQVAMETYEQGGTARVMSAIDAARDAERQQHQQTIQQLQNDLREAIAIGRQQVQHTETALRAAYERDETIQQQAEQIATLTQALRAAIDHDVIRAVAALRQQRTVAREQNGQTVFVSGTEAAREYLLETLACALSAGASRPTEGEQGRLGNYYGRRLTASIEDGQVLVAIGVQTLAHAVAYADWANPFDEASDDYIRTFAIADAGQFAKDVVSAMLAEREDGSTPLSDFLDKMSQAAIEDGSLGLHEDEHRIKHGETAPCETWAEPEQGAPQ